MGESLSNTLAASTLSNLNESGIRSIVNWPNLKVAATTAEMVAETIAQCVAPCVAFTAESRD